MSISTISFNNASRAQIMRVQNELREALIETSSNRHADVGRTLGRTTGIAVSYRAQETSLDRLLQSNKLVTQRLTLIDDALETAGKSAETLRNQLISGLGNDDFLNSAKQVAASGLDQLAGSLNLSVGGQYLLSGSQTDVRPLNPYGDGPGAAVKAHFDTFLQAAGKTAATVTKAEVEAYFGEGYPTGQVGTDGRPVTIAFDDLFKGEAWGNIFSNASDIPVLSRITKSETIESSVSTNAQAFRDLMAGYAAIDLASSQMGEGARAALSDAARSRLSAGTAGVTAIRSDLGNRLSRVETAQTSITQQKDIFSQHVSSLEEVDMVEASERVAALRTQLEASLRVTGMIREINILDYL